MATHVSDTAIEKLRQSMQGEVITPAHGANDGARKVWNADVDRKPAVIACCTTVDDVKAALAFGRSNGLQIAVRSGGHSFPGHSIADDALVLDLRRMNRSQSIRTLGAPPFKAGPSGRKWMRRRRPIPWP